MLGLNFFVLSSISSVLKRRKIICNIYYMDDVFQNTYVQREVLYKLIFMPWMHVIFIKIVIQLIALLIREQTPLSQNLDIFLKLFF